MAGLECRNALVQRVWGRDVEEAEILVQGTSRDPAFDAGHLEQAIEIGRERNPAVRGRRKIQVARGRAVAIEVERARLPAGQRADAVQSFQAAHRPALERQQQQAWRGRVGRRLQLTPQRRRVVQFAEKGRAHSIRFARCGQ